jgi:hypothetical protein
VVTNVVSFSPTSLEAPPTAPVPADTGGNRLLEHAAWINTRLGQLQPEALNRLEQMLEIEPHEATACLEGQARAAARDILTSEEALTVYRALNPGGWEPDTRIELKMTIVGLMGKLF